MFFNKVKDHLREKGLVESAVYYLEASKKGLQKMLAVLMKIIKNAAVSCWFLVLYDHSKAFRCWSLARWHPSDLSHQAPLLERYYSYCCKCSKKSMDLMGGDQ